MGSSKGLCICTICGEPRWCRSGAAEMKSARQFVGRLFAASPLTTGRGDAPTARDASTRDVPDPACKRRPADDRQLLDALPDSTVAEKPPDDTPVRRPQPGPGKPQLAELQPQAALGRKPGEDRSPRPPAPMPPKSPTSRTRTPPRTNSVASYVFTSARPLKSASSFLHC